MEIMGIVISVFLAIIILLLGFVIARLDKITDKIELLGNTQSKHQGEIENIKENYALKFWVSEGFKTRE
jgi:hypothetical protein